MTEMFFLVVVASGSAQKVVCAYMSVCVNVCVCEREGERRERGIRQNYPWSFKDIVDNVLPRKPTHK